MWGFPGFARVPAASTLQGVPRFLVESYVATSSAAFDDARAQARLTARSARDVSYVETTYLPGDETVLHLFDAPSAETLAAAGRRAGLEFERIVPAVSDATEPRKGNQ